MNDFAKQLVNNYGKPESPPLPMGVIPMGVKEVKAYASDEEALEGLQQKLKMIEDAVMGVIHGDSYGLYLWGEGGSCKSYTVLNLLQAEKADYKLFNSRMTGRGLFDRLMDFPESIHLLEDMEHLLSDDNAVGVLRSALWGQKKEGKIQRQVTWDTYANHLSFYFNGKIIMIANEPLIGKPKVKALASRMEVMQHNVSPQEIVALMRKIAKDGAVINGHRLEPHHCQEVCEYLIESFKNVQRNPDMRLLINSYSDFLIWDMGVAHHHWKDLVHARLIQRAEVTGQQKPESREARKVREQEMVRQICQTAATFADRLELWKERTGKSATAFKDRLNDVEAGFSEQDKKSA